MPKQSNGSFFSQLGDALSFNPSRRTQASSNPADQISRSFANQTAGNHPALLTRMAFGNAGASAQFTQFLNDAAVRHLNQSQIVQDWEAGDVNAASTVGEEIWAGRTNLARSSAEEWFRAAAERGNAAGMVNLSILLDDTGRVAESVQWLRRAAAQNDPQALYNLGVCYEKGHGVPGDMRTALSNYRQAADLSHPLAMSHVGLFLVRGEYLAQDVRKGIAYLDAAARADEPAAMFWLGGTYAGLVQKTAAIDMQKAEYWTIQAAEHGYEDAFGNAAIVFEKSDSRRAIHFYTLAARRGDGNSMARLRQLGSGW